MTDLLGPLVDPSRRIWWPALLVALAVAVMVQPRGLLSWRIWSHRSAVLDYQLLILRGVVQWAGLVPWTLSAYAVAVFTVRGMDGVLGIPSLPMWPMWAVTAAYTVVLFVASDLSRYVVHRLLHRVPVLWQLHQVHHSAEVLTPLTFYRAHPIESFLFAVRGAVATGVVTGAFFWLFRGTVSPWLLGGVGSIGLLFNVMGGNLRHTHVWLSYPKWLEHLLISPAQHQIHHADDPALYDANFGSYLAVWDWLGRSLEIAGARRELAFGVPDGERNHAPDDLVQVLVGPLVGISRLLPRGASLVLLMGLLVLPAAAWAEDEEDEEDTEEEEGSDDDDVEEISETISIFGERMELPRVAGSAHKVGQEELEHYEHDDIHSVLAPVPGVYVRGEDGYGLRPNIGLRGASSDRSAKVTLMEDGVLLAPAPYAAPAAYFFPLTTRMVGVEVFKGPASIRYGPNTIGGAVNLQSRPVPDRLDGGVDVAAGLRRSIKLHGWGGTRWAWGGVLVEGAHLTTDGFKDLDGGGSTGFDKSELMAKLRIAPTLDGPLRTAWDLKLGYAAERSRETYLGLSDADFEETPFRRYAASSEGLMTWQRTQAQLAWQLQASDVFDLRVVGYHHWMQRSWTKLNGFAGGPTLGAVLSNPDAGQSAVYYAVLTGQEDSATDDEVLLVGTNARAYHSFGVSTTARWSHSRKRVTQNLEVGVRVHGDRVHRDHSEDPFVMVGGAMAEEGGDVVQTTLSDASATALAAHVHEDLGLGPVRLLPGVRLEVIHTESDDLLDDEHSARTRAVLLPGMGLHVQPTPWLGILAGVHRGFSPVAPGQPEEVKPESSWNSELGARFAHRGTHIEAIGFFNDYSNLTGNCTLSAGCSDEQLDQQFNAGRVHVFGAEATFGQGIRLPEQMQLDLRVSYTWTGSRFRTGFVSSSPQFGEVTLGDSLPYVPEHQGSASLGFAFPVGHIGATVAARSAMRDLPGQGPIPEHVRVPASVLVDIAADVRITREVAVYTTISNLLNSRTMLSRRPFGARPGQPFQVMVGVKLTGRPEHDGIAELVQERRRSE